MWSTNASCSILYSAFIILHQYLLHPSTLNREMHLRVLLPFTICHLLSPYYTQCTLLSLFYSLQVVPTSFNWGSFTGVWDTANVLRCWRGCPRGIMVKAMDYGIAVSEFVLQSHYYVHFQANTLGKSMNTLIPPAMG